MVDVVEGEVDVEREVDIERDDYEEYEHEEFQELASPLLEEGGLSWHVVECLK